MNGQTRLLNFHYLAILLCSVSICWPNAYSSIACALLTTSCLLGISIQKKFYFSWIGIGIASLAIVQVIALFFAPDIMLGIQQIWLKLPFLLFPLLLFSNLKVDAKLRNHALSAFAYSVSLLSTIIILRALFRFFNHEIDRLSYVELIDGTWLTTTYLAIHCVFAIAILCYLFLKQEKRSKSLNLLMVVCFLVLHLTIVLLSSRIAFLVLLMVVSSLLIMLLKTNLLKRVLVTASYVVLISIASFSSGQLFERFGYVELADQPDISVVEKQKKMPRKVIWKCSLEKIQQSIPLGVGPGMQKLALMDCFQEFEFEEGIRRNMNAHNQFFEQLLSTGVMGLLALCILMLLLLLKALKNRDYLLLAFAIVFLGFSLTESILERQHGIMFIAFFASVLSLKHKQ